MRESLDNKIIVVELAGQSILLSNSGDNFKKELIVVTDALSVVGIKFITISGAPPGRC